MKRVASDEKGETLGDFCFHLERGADVKKGLSSIV